MTERMGCAVLNRNVASRSPMPNGPPPPHVQPQQLAPVINSPRYLTLGRYACPKYASIGAYSTHTLYQIPRFCIIRLLKPGHTTPANLPDIIFIVQHSQIKLDDIVNPAAQLEPANANVARHFDLIAKVYEYMLSYCYNGLAARNTRELYSGRTTGKVTWFSKPGPKWT